jgi:7-cyano-7-deazaguanine synthase
MTLDVPTDGAAGGIPITYVPARNTIMLSLALGWAEAIGGRDLFSARMPSTTPAIRTAGPNMSRRMRRWPTWPRRLVSKAIAFVHAPIIDMTKAEIILAGVKLGVDYGLTVSCYKADDDGRACGVCDSCRIRRAGFEAAGVPDPTRYQTSN